MTLNGVIALFRITLPKSVVLKVDYVYVLADRCIMSATKILPKESSF